MKVVIWIIGIFTASLIVTTIREVGGFILGGLPTALLYGATFCICGYLCRRWDEQHGRKKNINKSEKKTAKKLDESDDYYYFH